MNFFNLHKTAKCSILLRPRAICMRIRALALIFILSFSYIPIPSAQAQVGYSDVNLECASGTVDVEVYPWIGCKWNGDVQSKQPQFIPRKSISKLTQTDLQFPHHPRLH